MLDFDLAELYQIETKRLNEQVKRNISRFPREFMFQLTIKELRGMRSQFATASITKRNRNALPYVFTEHGVAMLASVINTEKAVQMNIAIIKAFIALREFVSNYKELADEVKVIRQTVTNHDEQLVLIYGAIENLLKEKADQQSWTNRERIGFKS